MLRSSSSKRYAVVWDSFVIRSDVDAQAMDEWDRIIPVLQRIRVDV